MGNRFFVDKIPCRTLGEELYETLRVLRSFPDGKTSYA